MKSAILFLLGAAAGFILARNLNTSSRFISLSNIRRGIKNEWYTAKLAMKDGQYYVRLTGSQTDGEITSSYYEIAPSTYEALLADGVEVETSENA